MRGRSLSDNLPNSKIIAECWKIIDIISITKKGSIIRRNRGSLGWKK